MQQYYVENSHPAIIDPDEWDAAQAEIERRKNSGSIGRCGSPFSGKIVCGECGGYYGKKVWGSYKSDKAYRREIWRCNDKYKRQGKPGKGCATPHVTEDEVKQAFLAAFNHLMENRDGLVEDCRMALAAISDTAAIDIELTELRREMDVVAELSRQAIHDYARTALDEADFNDRNNSYHDCRRQATERVDELETLKRERLAKAKMIEGFIRDIQKRPLVLTEWDEALWLAVVDKVTVGTDGAMVFAFRNDAEVTA